MRISLSIPQDFLDVLSAVCGVFYGKINYRIIKAICTDSRECEEGDIFFAIKGKEHDGNEYIDQAISSGAIPIGEGVNSFGIKVADGGKALLEFAKFYKKQLPCLLHTVAITGSVGKTTTKEFLAVLLKKRYKIHANRKNYNNRVGVPITVLSAPRDTEILICELGMNHMGEIRELSDIIAPDIALITKIGTAHIGNLGSIKRIATAKLEITHGLTGVLLIPKEQELLISGYDNTKTFSAYSNLGNYGAIKNRFNMLEIYRFGELAAIIDFNFLGYHLYECLSAAVSIAMELNLTIQQIISGIQDIGEHSYRHEIQKTPYGFDIMNDAYNSSAESVIASANYLCDLKGYSGKGALLGDMLELGEQTDAIHTKIGSEIARLGFDRLFLIGDHATQMRNGAVLAGFPKEHVFINTDKGLPEVTASQILRVMKRGEILLAKASRGINLDRIINLIVGV